MLERLGMRYFERRSDVMPPVEAEDEVHYLNPRERAALRGIIRWAVVRSALAGGLSGGVTALAEFFAKPVFLVGPAADDLSHTIAFWAVVLGVTGVATFFEISFLYWDALRSVHRLSHAAGLDLFDGKQGQAVATALVRAALELPNPGDRMFGVDPRREISRLWLIVATLIYKAKIGVTNFLIKMFVRRLMGRATLRAWDAFVAIPVTAVWNGWVTWRVLREACLRVMAPSAAMEYVAAIVGDPAALSPGGRTNLLRAAASSVVRTRDMHPNLMALLAELHERLGTVEGEVIDDWHLFLDELPTLAEPEQEMALRLMAVACVIDGRISRREYQLLRTAHEVCGSDLDDRALRRLYRQYTRGDSFDAELLRALGQRVVSGSPSTT